MMKREIENYGRGDLTNDEHPRKEKFTGRRAIKSQTEGKKKEHRWIRHKKGWEAWKND